MVKIVPTPDWFLGKDVIIEAFSFIVLAIFSFLSLKNYRVSKNKRFLYLGVSFGIIALAQLAAVVTKLVLYYDIGPSQEIGRAIVTSQVLSSVDIFYYLGFFFHRFLTLTGFYILYRIPRESRSIIDSLVIIYFLAISILLIQEVSIIFHITALILMVMIVIKYYRIYQQNYFFNTKILVIAFSILAFGQVLYLFSSLSFLYATANIVELISYTLLLGLIIRIRKYGKKKKPYGHNIGHASNDIGKRRKS